MTLLQAFRVEDVGRTTVIFETDDDYPYISRRQPGRPFHLVRMVLGEAAWDVDLALGTSLLRFAVANYAPGATTRAPSILPSWLEPDTRIEVCETDGLHYARFCQGDAVVFATLVVPQETI